ncbi:DUF222 domain-containing protein [Gryllotalpicola kribbensis]|uniref:DUF222 domain-containing protein n=1 Tax=Gryllotalpicola kribbensis TaxID=993084 RepID=A0ABP8AZA1_9MICO
MTLEVSFDLDVENSAFVLGQSWQAEQYERVCAGRREIARLEAHEVRILAGLLYDAEGAAGEDAIDAGDPQTVTRRHELAVRSIAMEVAASTNTSIQAVEVKLGEAWTLANELTDTLACLEAGEISRAHAHELIAVTGHLERGSRREAEHALLPWAKRLAPSPFRRKAKQILEALEKDSFGERHDRAYAKRRVDITAGRDGMAHLEAYIDGADAALIKAGLENAANEARQAGDPRSRKQLEADFVVELLTEGNIAIGSAADGGAAAPLPVTRRAAVTVDVLIPAATLAGKNEQGALIPGFGMIDPQRARELVAMAPSLKRILTDPITGAVLNFDRTSYRIPAGLRRVLRIRDGHCRAPACTLSSRYTDVDHAVDYARGGPTSLANTSELCEGHHYVKHEGGWSLTQYADGVQDWRAPSGRTYRTYPDNPFAGAQSVVVPAPFDLPPDDDDDDDPERDEAG